MLGSLSITTRNAPRLSDDLVDELGDAVIEPEFEVVGGRRADQPVEGGQDSRSSADSSNHGIDVVGRSWAAASCGVIAQKFVNRALVEKNQSGKLGSVVGGDHAFPCPGRSGDQGRITHTQDDAVVAQPPEIATSFEQTASEWSCRRRNARYRRPLSRRGGLPRHERYSHRDR